MTPTDARRILFTADARFTATPAAAGTKGPGRLVGYPIVWGATSSDRGGYVVRLLKGSARQTANVHALFHHDYRLVLADLVSGFLQLDTDDVGVRATIDCPDTEAGRSTYTLVDTKRVRGMSFAMTRAPSGKEATEDGRTVLVVDDFEFDEVTVTPIPAFDTTIITTAPPAGADGDFSKRRAAGLELERLRFAGARLSRAGQH